MRISVSPTIYRLFLPAILCASAFAQQMDYVTQIKNKPAFDVRAYGAKGDGVADDTAEIQAAITAAATGGLVFLPAGNYKITGTLTISGSRVTLAGAGRSSTITCTGGTFDCITHDGGSYNTVRDLSIVGSGKTGGWAFRTTAAGYLTIEDVQITDVPNGIWLYITVSVHVNRININNTPSGYGILVFGGNDQVIENVIHDNIGAYAVAGIRLEATGGAFVSHVDMIHCTYGLLIDPPAGANVIAVVVDSSYFDTGGTGIRVAPAALGSAGTAPVSDFICTDCWASGNAANGVHITGVVEAVKFKGLLAHSNEENGVLIASSSGDVSITDSSILANAQDGLSNNITVAANTNNFRLQNNSIGGDFFDSVDAAVYALQISGTSGGFYVTGNTLTAGSSGTLSDTATGVSKVVRDNLNASNAVPTIASAASIAVPAYHPDVIVLSGTTTVSTITGVYQGKRVSFIKSDAGSISFDTAGNIAAAATLAQFGRVDCIYEANNVKWFCK
jgi:hypothetical protein